MHSTPLRARCGAPVTSAASPARGEDMNDPEVRSPTPSPTPTSSPTRRPSRQRVMPSRLSCGSRTAQVDRRSGDPFSELGTCEPRRRPRPVRTRPGARLEDCLRIGQGSRQPPAASPTSWGRQHRQNREGSRDSRTGPRHDLAAHQPEELDDHDAAPGSSGRCRRRPALMPYLSLAPAAAAVAGAGLGTPGFDPGHRPTPGIPDEPAI